MNDDEDLDELELSAEIRDELEQRLADEPEVTPWPSGEEVIARLRRELGEAGPTS